MQEKELKIEYIISSIKELSDADKDLLLKAQEVLKNSYSPYSHFSVGAAARIEDGTVIKGANQENGAYPSGLCAERVCMFAAKSQYANKKILALAIASENQNKDRVETFPCGACLQVAAEYEIQQESNIKIIVQKNCEEVYVFESVKCLFPFAFQL